MVKIQQPSEYDKLDALVRETCTQHGLKLHVAGWTRKTYDVFWEDRKAGKTQLVARVESFATTNGEIRVYDDRGLPFAQTLGEAIEKAFSLSEAVIIQERTRE